ncbi:cardiolipin synthase [Falsarthrobacter nasiphocae]|uniref:Cardiolipin synthase n=1 Tax=Falsarthrobacter nasiphocae TaxID=189863 RepID=A0AAE3YHH5_9MICC|nr:cardiolipin synthase [Falsarthrobacter nasiphocae]MDR6892295.1 cardiolipin synthase [Falsarthrobacter nasiphocae]
MQWLIPNFDGMPDELRVALVVLDYTIRILAIGIIPGRRRPVAAMAWLLAIFFIPIVGLALFLLIGTNKLNEKRTKEQERITRYVMDRSKGFEVHWTEFNVDEWVQRAAELNRNLSGFPAADGNEITLYPDYIEALDAMTQAVEEAEDSVNVEFYILSVDSTTQPFFDALVRASERGVTVRVLYDHLGSARVHGYGQTKKFLKSNKIQFRRMLPINPFRNEWRRPDLRNHRKILVIDQEVAFSGSLNLIEREYRKKKNHRIGRQWVELLARFEGPNAAELKMVFAADWYAETGESLADGVKLHDEMDTPGDVTCQVIPSGPGYANENNLRFFNMLFYNAKERISVTSPYFVPDESLLVAMTTAAQRGVDVELFVSEKGDQFMVDHAQRSYYEAIMEAGVKIYRYPAPYVLHAKHITVDDDLAVIGSSNMDQRSFSLNAEVSVLMVGGDIVPRMRKVEDGYRAVSTQLDLEEWRKRPRIGRFMDNVCRLTSGLQ